MVSTITLSPDDMGSAPIPPNPKPQTHSWADVELLGRLYHNDCPLKLFCLVLQDRYGGFLGQQLVADFAAYARTVVAALGDRVVYWTTFNEPQSICLLGFGYGSNAPGTAGAALCTPAS